MSLRALNLGSKFVVFFLLAKYAEPEQLSLFGLYWTSVVSLSALMGLELYGHTIRTFLCETNLGRKRQVIGRHFGGMLLINAFIMPITLLLIDFFLERLSPLVYLLGLHLISELLAQDNSRLLIGLGRPLQAIILNTLRGAFWATVAVVYIFLEKSDLDVQNLIFIWLSFSYVSLILSFLLVSNSLESIVKPKIELNWLLSAMKVSFVLILCALSLRALITGDKYIAESLFGPTVSAYYIFYATISFAVSGLIESGVSAWYYPKLVSSIKTSQFDEFFKIRKRFFVRNLISSFLLSILVLVISYLGAKYYLHESYLDNYRLLLLCILGVSIYSCSMPDHYTIYGFEKDKIILFINLTAVVIFVSSFATFKSMLGIDSVAIAFAAALIYLAVARRIAANILTSKLRLVS